MRAKSWMAAVLGVSGTAFGQDIPPPERAWTLQFEPSAWFVAAGGKMSLPNAPAPTQATRLEDLNLDSTRLAPGGELHLYDGKWRITVGGFRMEQIDRGMVASGPGQVGPVSFAAGDRVVTSISFTSVEATVAYSLDLPEWTAGKPGSNYAGRMEVLGGVRVYDIGFDFTAPGGSMSADETEAHPLVGIKWSMEVIDQFTIDAQIDVGGFTVGGDTFTYGYNIMAGFMWRPVENVGVQIGYRDLAFQLRSGPEAERFEYRGALQGLFAGIVIRF